MLSVHHNLKQSFAQRQVQSHALQRDTSSERLASAQRINSAADDSAGLQISNRLSTRISSAGQVQRNLADGLSYCQIAEGALQEVSTAIQRMRVLAVYAQNGALSQADRRNLQQEFSAMAAEINSVAYKTKAFGKHPLLGDQPASVGDVAALDQLFSNGQSIGMPSGLRSITYVPSGTTGLVIDLNDNGANDDIQIFTRNGKHLAGTVLGSQTWASNGINNATDLKNIFLKVADGYLMSASYDDTDLNLGTTTNYNGMNIQFTGDQKAGGSNLEQLQIDQITEPLIIAVTGTGAFNITLSWASLGTQSNADNLSYEGPVRITANPTSQTDDDFIQIDKAPSTLTDLALADLALDPIEKAIEAMNALSNAMSQVDNYRTDLGAKMAQLQSSGRQMSDLIQTHSQAVAQIRDTDFAKETGASVNSQIMMDAATAMLAQAGKMNGSQVEILLKQLQSAT